MAAVLAVQKLGSVSLKTAAQVKSHRGLLYAFQKGNSALGGTRFLSGTSGTQARRIVGGQQTGLRPQQLVTRRMLSTKVPYEKYTFNWWKEWAIIFGVFAVTGSSSVYVTRPLVHQIFGLEGSLKEGPWNFRAAYICTTLPAYSLMLVTFGTIFGRGPYFRSVAARMWSRLIPPLKKYF